MRSRAFSHPLLLATVAVLAVAGLTVGIVAARADQTTQLPPMSAPELLFAMATADHEGMALSGDIAWTNDLFGQDALAGMAQQGAAQSPLLASGTGRIWMSPEGMRVESQGGGGDQVAVANAKQHAMWTWTSTTSTATEYTMPAGHGTDGTSPEPSPTGTFGPAEITRYLKELAPTAKVTVAGQTQVAGRDAYVLEMTPTVTDTAIGRITVAVDGEKWVPLQMQVYAAGADKSTLSFGFTSISFATPDASLFAFTPPDGAKVVHKDLSQKDGSQQATESGTHEAPWSQAEGKRADRQPLTLAQAQAKTDFTIATPHEYAARDFAGAAVLDKAQLEQQLKAMQQAQGAAAGAMAPEATPSAAGADASPAESGATPQIDFAKLPAQAVMLQYGKGFGAVWLAEAPSNAEIDKQLKQLPEVFAPQNVNGTPVRFVGTPLGSVAVWKQGDLTLVAGGLVTQSDLADFVAAVH